MATKDPNADLHRAPCDGGCGQSIWMPRNKNGDQFLCRECRERLERERYLKYGHLNKQNG